MKIIPGAKLLKLLILLGLSQRAASTELPNTIKPESQLVKKIAESAEAPAGDFVVLAATAANSGSSSSNSNETSTTAERQPAADRQQVKDEQRFNSTSSSSGDIVQESTTQQASGASSTTTSDQTQVAESRLDTAGQTPSTPNQGPKSQLQERNIQAPRTLQENRLVYPIDHYPSASYTAPVQHKAPPQPPATTVTNQARQPSFELLLNPFIGASSRASHSNYFDNNADEHLLLSGWNDQLLAFPSSASTSRNSKLGELIPATSNLNKVFNNHNYGAQAASTLTPTINMATGGGTFNSGLIQNLTASLFPVQKLSNATMSTLSELLANKTRQTQATKQTASNQQQQLPFLSTKNNKSLFQLGDQFVAPSSSSKGGVQDYLEALLSDHRFSSALGLGDYFNTKPTSAGAWTAPQSSINQQQINWPDDTYFRKLVNNGQHQHQQQQQHKATSLAEQPSRGTTSSNVYNTYAQMPSMKTGDTLTLPKAIATTNGQAMNIAANMYENYLDQTYRYPLNAHHQHQSTINNNKDSIRQAQAGNNYQYIQQHTNNQNNQNHLDKIVYHSAPFRPSIVNPPTLASSMARNVNSTNAQHLAGKPKSEADSKSVSYASLNASNNNNNDNNYRNHNLLPDFLDNNNGQYLGERNASRFAPTSQQQQLHSLNTKFEPMRQHDDYDTAFEQFVSTTANSYLNSSASNQQNQTMASTNAGEKGALQQQQQQVPSSLAQLPGPQLLLDLYEREIDNQIRDAIYTDHQQHFNQQLASSNGNGLSSSAPASIVWPSVAPAIQASPSSFQEEFDPLNSWRSSATSSYAPQGGLQSAPSAAASQQAAGALLLRPPAASSQLAAADSLAAALHELPTFSASDLQPLLTPQAVGSNTAALSMLSSLNQHHTGNSALVAEPSESTDMSALASLASQLLPYSSATSSVGGGGSGGNSYFGPSSLSSLLLGGAFNTDSYASMQTAAATSPSIFQLANEATKQQAPQTSTALPSLLVKLQSGPLTSILTSPFAHIYANLPRYRYNSSSAGKQAAAKQQQQQNQNQNREPALNKQQAAAAAAAAATAQLIAASGRSLTPLQVAMIQAQAATSAYLNAAAAAAASEPIPTAEIYEQASSSAIKDNNHHQNHHESGPFFSIASGLASSSGLSPLVWRGLLSPIHWSRKQTNSQPGSAGGSQQTNSKVASHLLQSSTKNQQVAAMSPLLSSLWAASSPLSQLLAPLASQSAQTSSTSDKKPRLKIKILKIPVAFYDNGPSSLSAAHSVGGRFPAAPAIINEQLNLMPAHLQPNPTAASLMASLSCPLHKDQALSPHSNNQLFASQMAHLPTAGANNMLPASAAGQTSTPAALSLGPTQANTNPPAATQTAVAASSAIQHSGSSGVSSGNDYNKPGSIKDFSDINQPNDLQVSPANQRALTQMASGSVGLPLRLFK